MREPHFSTEAFYAQPRRWARRARGQSLSTDHDGEARCLGFMTGEYG